MKVKWIAFKSIYSLSEIKERLLGCQYNEEVGRGFIVSTSSAQYIIFRHVSKRRVVEVQEGPFGEQFERESITYDSVSFRLSTEFPGVLELTNPKRRTKSFFNDLRMVLGIGLVVSEFNYDCFEVVNNIEDGGTPCEIFSVELSEITIRNSAAASLSLKGANDLRRAIKEFLGDRPFKAKKVCFRVIFNDKVSVLSVSSTGLIQIDSDDKDALQAVKLATYNTCNSLIKKIGAGY